MTTKNTIEIPMRVMVDENGDEFYEAKPVTSLTIDLARVSFTVAHPEEDGGDALLIVGKRTDTDLMMSEVKRAEEHFRKVPGGYLGYGYFISNWKSWVIPQGPQRKTLVDRLLQDESLEMYTAPDGKDALRTRPSSTRSS